MAQYTGHSAKHGGLQGHSVGEYYPIITARYGNGSHGLIFGGYEIRGLTPSLHNSIREVLHCVNVLQGWNKAMDYFQGIGAKPLHAR